MTNLLLLNNLRRRRILSTPTPGPPVRAAFAEGSLGDGATDFGIRAGGLNLILRLQSDVWVAAGATFDAQRQNIIDGITADSAITTGWNALIRDTLSVSLVTRTSTQIVTIGPLPAFPAYDIPTWETVTATIPDSAIDGSGALVATPSFRLTPVIAAVASVLGDPVTKSLVQVVPEVAVPDIIRRNISELPNVRKAPVFDFETGRFSLSENGQIEVDSGIKSLRNWIRKTLLTPRGRLPIYDFEYGSDINQLIGRDQSYVSARLENVLLEALSGKREIVDAQITKVVYAGESVVVDMVIRETIEGNQINEQIEVGVR